MQSPTKLTYISRKRSKENDISKSPICFTKLSNTPKKQLPHSQSHSKLKRSVDTSPKTVREHHTRVLTMPNFASTDRIQKSEIVTPRGDSRGTSSRNKPAQGTKIPSASKSILKTPNKEVKAANERSKQPQNLREHILYLIMKLEKSQAISLEHEYEIKSLKSELEASMKESNQKLGMLVKMLKNQLNDLNLIEKKEQTINEIYQRRVADIDGVVKLLEADGNTPMKSEEKQISNDSANLAHEKLQREMVLLKAERDKYKSMLDVMAIELEFHSKHCQFAIGQEDSVKKKANSKFSIEIGHHSEKKSVQEKKVSPMKLALGKVLKRLENIGTISKGSNDDYLENESSSRRSRQSPESTLRLATGRSLSKQHHSLRLNETANNLSDRWANLSLSDRQAKEVHWGSLQHSMQRDASLSANYPFERQCFTNASNKHTVKLNTEILLKKISENVELHDQSDTPNHKREEFVDEKNNIGYERQGFRAETTEIKLESYVKQDNDNDDKILETTTKNVSDLDIRFETALNTEEMRDNTSLPQNQHALNSNQDKPQHQELEELNQSGKTEQQQVEQLQSKLIEETDNGFEFKLIVETQMPDSRKEQVPSSELKAKKRRGETEKRASIQDFNNSGQQVEVTEENAGKIDQSEQNIISRDTNLEIENKARAQGHGQEISPTDALALGVEPTISEVIEEIFIHSNGNSPTKQEFEKEDTREPSVFNYSTGKVEPSSNKYENNTDNRENHEANVFICKAHNNPSCFSCAMDLEHLSREISKLQSKENEYTSQLENLKLGFIKEAREKANAIRSLEEENTTLKKLTDTVQQPTSYSTMFELQAELDRVRGQLDELKYFLLPSRANEADDLSHQGSITHIYGTPAEVGTPKSLSHHEEDAPNEPNQDLEYSQVLEVEKVADFPEKTLIPQRIQNLNLQSHPTFQPVSQFEWFSQTINTVSNKHDWEISEKLNKVKDARVEEIKERLIPLIQKLKKEELLQEFGFICGIDCTVSNVFTGRKSFGNRHLHEISTHQLNFYEKALSTVGAVATNFSHEGKLSVYLFGDDQTHDKNVRTLYADEVGNEECYGIDHALAEYRRSIAKIFFSGPTSFRPLIDKAIEIAQRKKEFQLLMIIGDGAVTNVQENVNAIAEASNFPIAIMMVGVGDGNYNQYPKDPWQGMKELVNLLPPRRFENIRFLRYEDEMPLEEFAESVFEYVIKAYQFCAESKMIETLDKATSRRGEEPGRSVCIPVNEISDSPTIQSQKGGAFHSGGNLKEEDAIQSSNAQESNVVISQIYRENNSSENSSQIELETGDRGHVKVKKVVKKKVSKKLSSPKTEVQKEEVSSSNKSSVVEEPAETEMKVNVVGKKGVKKVVKKKKTGNSIEETTTQQVETGNEHKMSIKAEGGVSDNLGNRKSIKKTTKKKADPVSESIENDPKIQSSESLLKEPEVSVLEESKEESRPEHIKPKTVKKFVKKKVTESSLQPSETPLAHTDMKESKDNSLISPKITSIEHVGKTEALPSKSNPSEPSSKEILKTKVEEGSIMPSEREPNDLKVKKVVKKVVKKK